MPELPEVETIAADLAAAGLKNLSIERAVFFWPKTLATPSISEFESQIRGKKVLSIGRRAKFLSFVLSGKLHLFVHLRMTGRFSFTSGSHVRAELHLSDGRILYYHDTRKFGRWFLVEDPQVVTGKLGPEPLEKSLSEEKFAGMVRGHRRQLKPLLLDQSFLAGLGNIYVDEALWDAQLHPQMLASDLTKAKTTRLLKSIRHVLQKGLNAQGTTLGSGKTNYYRVDGRKGTHQDILYVFRRTGLPCPRCGTPIERLIVAQRSTHICPKCQLF